jgi:hypothetical protein
MLWENFIMSCKRAVNMILCIGGDAEKADFLFCPFLIISLTAVNKLF